MYIFFFSVSLLASIIGAICGIGGGVIIKPLLDTTGIMSVSAVSFLSGCTVLSMSIISVFKSLSNNKNAIDLKISTPLAIGGALGGILGKSLFQYIYLIFPDENNVGVVQAAVLILITIATLIYTISASNIKTYHFSNIWICLTIGLVLGVFSSFLGIGGGPINIVVLYFFFSMDTKQAAANSLYIIMFSQFTSLLNTIVSRAIPEFDVIILSLMVLGGVLGGIAGNKIYRRISVKNVNRLFIGLMIVIVLVNIFNIFRFTGSIY